MIKNQVNGFHRKTNTAWPGSMDMLLGAERRHLTDSEVAGFITPIKIHWTSGKKDQNYASSLINIVINSFLLCLFCSHHDKITLLPSYFSLSVLRDQFPMKNLFSALFAFLLRTSLQLCSVLTRKLHFCCSILKKYKLLQIMPNYKNVSLIKPL